MRVARQAEALLRYAGIPFRYRYLREVLRGMKNGWFPVFVPYPVTPNPRYGYGSGPHPELHALLDRDRSAYRSRLRSFEACEPYLRAIPAVGREDAREPFWSNPWFSGLDAIALYAFLRERKPARYLEVGSGHSTRFARRAIRDHGLSTRIVSIDPCPRVEIDALADEIVRAPLEAVDLGRFERLESGDVLFVDSSHRCFMNSDVTVFFLEVLPRIASGVIVHLHDIHLPYDYPPERRLHYESEQYLLAVSLLAGAERQRVLLPNRFVLEDAELAGELDFWWSGPGPQIPRRGSSFWFEKR